MLRRPPSSVPASHAASSGSLQGLNPSSSAQEKRLEYLERIVQSQTGPNTPLDLDTLKNLAERADRQRSPSVATSHEDEVDKSITMQSLDGNVTRMYSSSGLDSLLWQL